MLMYIEEFIGPDTVNTIAPGTLEVVRDHGQVRGATLAQGWADAGNVLRRLASAMIDVDAITEKLQAEGIATFAEAYDRVLAAVDKKRHVILTERAGMKR
jgi:transaldolase